MKTFRLLLVVLFVAGTATAQVAYSYRAGATGGGGYVEIDPSSGKIVKHRGLFELEACRKAKKVRFTADGKHVAVTASTSKTPNFFVTRVAEGGAMLPVSLPGEPDEVRAAGLRYVISCEGGTVALVDAVEGTLAGSWNARTQATPPASNGEDVFVFPDGKTALVSFESDHRIMLLRVPEMALIADLALPRGQDATGVPSDVAGRGPQPEIVLASVAANAIVASSDKFGAALTLDLDAAMQGKLQNAVYHTTAPDESWGTSYPDRAGLVDALGGHYALFTNVGIDGGAALVDLAARRIVKRYAVPHGLEKPEYMPFAKLAVSAPAGKLKGQGGRRYIPGTALYLFNFDTASAAQTSVIPVELGTKVFHAAPVNRAASPFVVLAIGDKGPTELGVFSLLTRKLVDRQPARGAIQRLDSR